jgi:hypothetical protein
MTNDHYRDWICVNPFSISVFDLERRDVIVLGKDREKFIVTAT